MDMVSRNLILLFKVILLLLFNPGVINSEEISKSSWILHWLVLKLKVAAVVWVEFTGPSCLAPVIPLDDFLNLQLRIKAERDWCFLSSPLAHFYLRCSLFHHHGSWSPSIAMYFSPCSSHCTIFVFLILLVFTIPYGLESRWFSNFFLIFNVPF